jgi:putative ABC transport system permease protein
MTILPHLSSRQFRAILRSGIKSLMLHRLRSVLTTLGMVFGVCSVIAMLAIGEGANYEAQQQIQELGSQNIILRSKKPSEEETRTQGQDNQVLSYGLSYDDVQGIRKTVPGVSVIVPDRKRRDYAFHRRERLEVELVGTVPWYPELRNRVLQSGRFLSDRDLANNSKVCVLEEGVVMSLFPLSYPLGETVRVGRHYFEVVGILRDKDQPDGGPAVAGLGTAAVAPRMFVPLSTARALYGEITVRQRGNSFDAEEVELHEVTVRVDDLDQVQSVARVISAQLARDHAKKDYEVIVPLELLRQAERTKRIFSTVLGSIAAISLLVGGIGIMNIMLASVSERTREIGIRRALGAKRFDIVAQFLVETTLLASIGGLIGVLVGVSIPAVVGMLTDMITIVTWWSPMMALTISATTGVAFGLYPAYHAAQMDPVEALRHE